MPSPECSRGDAARPGARKPYDFKRISRPLSKPSAFTRFWKGRALNLCIFRGLPDSRARGVAARVPWRWFSSLRRVIGRPWQELEVLKSPRIGETFFVHGRRRLAGQTHVPGDTRGGVRVVAHAGPQRLEGGAPVWSGPGKRSAHIVAVARWLDPRSRRVSCRRLRGCARGATTLQGGAPVWPGNGPGKRSANTVALARAPEQHCVGLRARGHSASGRGAGLAGEWSGETFC